MAAYWLKNGRIREWFRDDAAGFEPTAIFHLNADGEIRQSEDVPALEEGEGLLMYTGDLYVEPLEIQVEFLKTGSAERWLEALVLRHVDRVRQIPEDLCISVEIKEVGK